MKNIRIFLIFIFVLSISVISAETISQTSFFVKVYNNTIQIVSNEYSGNNQEFTFGILKRNESNSTEVSYVPYTEFNYTFVFVKNISVDIGIVNKWADCMNETDTCKLNAAMNFTQCSLSIQSKDNELTNKQTEINNLTQEKTDTQNQKWLFAIAGAVIAVLILLGTQGKLGIKVKEKSAQEFNRTQAG